MGYWCNVCDKQVRLNYPYGRKSKPIEVGHELDCQRKKKRRYS